MHLAKASQSQASSHVGRLLPEIGFLGHSGFGWSGFTLQAGRPTILFFRDFILGIFLSTVEDDE